MATDEDRPREAGGGDGAEGVTSDPAGVCAQGEAASGEAEDPRQTEGAGPCRRAPPPPPPDAKEVVTPKVADVELCGDEPWFAEAAVRRRLREFVAEAHKENRKSWLGRLQMRWSESAQRTDGRQLGAGGVLRLGGAHLGGYGESDIAYAYRQLSRALHPDKNPDLPKAPAAFHRLSEAADELREGLNQQRHALQTLVSAMGGTATDQMCERPQEALFAEACRLLSAICGLAGEGEVPPAAQSRALGAFSRSGMYHGSQPQSLLSDWFEKTQLVDLFGSTTTAYDCAPKRYRAQFLCWLNRAAVVEAKRFNDCVRSQWHVIMQSFPELGLWRNMWDMISQRVWDSSNDPPEVQKAEKPKSRSRSRRRKSKSRSRRRRSRSGRRKEPEDVRPRGGVRAEIEFAADRQRDIAWENRWTTSDDPNAPKVNSKTRLREEKLKRKRAIEEHPTTGVRACRWGRKWRAAICAVLPSGLDGATKPDDLELRKFGFHLWKEIVRGAAGTDAERVLGLFRADKQSARTFGWENKGEQNPASRGLDPDTPPCEWAFVPITDLLLVVGEGVIGVTAEGLLANNPSGHKRVPPIQCFKKPGQKKSEAEKALTAALTAAAVGQAGARPAGPLANGSEAPPMMMPPSMMMAQAAAMGQVPAQQAKPSKWDVI
ncbi:unnamed protein product [Prorocentrum cordatum]|uniref:J domain-containing protein n=1 Tax=Prorocentrum cordatum TaxID=2364126 RepID=A0ABN9XVZ4_9DINO|nr:unnamed protein product [Polarella glacialis]